MGRFLRPILALSLALFARPGPATGPAATYAIDAPALDADWYSPLAEDFRPHYERDPANGQKQTWEQYWGWVESFYRGNLLARGWSDRARLAGGERPLGGRAPRLRSRLNALGREIGAEWAKDYDTRRIGSAELLAWGKMMEKARDRDDGSGGEIHRTLEAIGAEHHRKVRGVSAR